ncbi:MFS transporter [Streptomyces sp. ISL-98]|uniref:MFS transporter n=1 Tax=Streptomyces sp. ISL-98 TaxID=2819192 RepID=UPI001BE689ED|nr:MFS transporter [Streptomyces sp. ISL-98]MBT2508165.1 MFS transporter [Streptomyces sp. ISL-98]
MTAKGGPSPRDRRPLAAILAAETISTVGNSLTLIGVPWFVLQATGSAGRAGVVAFCATLPVVLSALVGGPVIDRLGRRRVSIATDLICGISVAAIPLLFYAGALEFWMLCVLMGISGFVATPGTTARHVLVPDLAERADTTLTRAASLFQAASSGARMVGASLAGVLIALLGAEAVLLLDGVTFALSALLVAAGVRGVRAAEPVKNATSVSLATYRTELRQGYSFVARRDRLLLAVILIVMLTNGLNQGWSSVLLPVHAKENLGGATQLGLLSAIFGGAALLGALLYGAFGDRFPRRGVFAAALLIGEVPRFVVAALTDGTAPLAVTLAAGGLAVGTLNPILTTVMYERVPLELRTRVAGITTAGCQLAIPLGGLAAGLLVDGTGLVPALLLFGGVYFLATLSPLLFPSWREMNRETDREMHSVQPPPVSSSGPSRPSAPAPEAPAPRPSAS